MVANGLTPRACFVAHSVEKRSVLSLIRDTEVGGREVFFLLVDIEVDAYVGVV